MKFILILIHLLILICGYLVFFNYWVSPTVIPYFNIFAISFIFIIVVNILMLILWIFYRIKWFIIFLILSLPLFWLAQKNINPFGEAQTSNSDLKMVTYNVKYFYDDPQGISDLLKAEAPDIIFFQEMGARPDTILPKNKNGTPYYFEDYNSIGIASRYPIIESQSFQVENYPLAYAYADIALQSDTIRFINFYLESLHLNQEDIKEPVVNAELKGKSKDIISKIAKAAKIHQQQIQHLRAFIRTTPHPIIMAGDMNAVPHSYEYHALGNGFKDAFEVTRWQLGKTFNSFKYPLRLDYVFVDKQIRIKSHKIERVNFSDHYPVIVELQLP